MRLKYQYEFIEYTEGLPLKAFVHSVDAYAYHWHKEMEIMFVLQGSVEIRVGQELYTLRENDLILVNRNEVHSTNRTDEDNILLALQISVDFFSQHFHSLQKMRFICNTRGADTARNDAYDFVRGKLADVIWTINKRNEGYSLEIMGHVHQLLSHLVRHFDYTVVDDKNMELQEKDLLRLKRITGYVNAHFREKVTLKDIASREYLSFYYLSHFIKDKMGISFQTYLTSVRLESAVRQLRETDKTISEIVFETGFPNTKSFNKAFKAKYAMTPSVYRKEIVETDTRGDVLLNQKNAKYYLDFDRGAALRKILTYRTSQTKQQAVVEPADHTERVVRREVKVQTVSQEPNSASGEAPAQVQHTWRRLTTFGRAFEGLRKAFKEQLERLQRDIGFEYIRFHGILNDEMMILRKNAKGEFLFNWSYVDELLDLLLENGLKPFVELGFMPSLLKSNEQTVFQWKGNISPPARMEEWTDLIRAFTLHIIERYGLEQVREWKFEVWNEPDLEDFFWSGTKEAYFAFYEATAGTIKAIDPTLQVGGPAVVYMSLQDTDFTEAFLTYCKQKQVPIDFFTYHVYTEKMPTATKKQSFKEQFQQARQSRENQYHGPDHLLRCIAAYDRLLTRYYGRSLPVFITEWNASAWCRNLIHDTCFKAPYIIENALNTDRRIDGLGYWTFTDLMEELGAGPTELHGGFGLITRSGIPKPGYYAYEFLGRLGTQILARKEGCIITRGGERIQALVWNFAYYDNLYMSGDVSALDSKNRYDVFEEKLGIQFDLAFELKSGQYDIVRTRLNRGSGSVFDNWLRMGAPACLTRQDVAYLNRITVPERHRCTVDVQAELNLTAHVSVHGVELIELTRRKT